MPAAASISGLWLLQRFLLSPKKPEILLATVPDEKIPERGALVYRLQRFALIREHGEVYALSLVCTHLGCTLAVTPQELTCPCHGSTFDRYGVVTRGPANVSLPRLRLQRQQNQWLVYSG